MLFDASNTAYFRARIDAASTQFQLFKATAAGAGSRTSITLPPRTDATAPDLGTFGISPDGTTLVFAADAPTATRYDFYITPVASISPMKITDSAGTGRALFTTPVVFSPDGKSIAMAADFLRAGTPNVRNEPYVIATDGSTPAPRRLVAVTDACGDCGIGTVQ